MAWGGGVFPENVNRPGNPGKISWRRDLELSTNAGAGAHQTDKGVGRAFQTKGTEWAKLELQC